MRPTVFLGALPLSDDARGLGAGENPCLYGPGVQGDVRDWSEDALTARTRAVWAGGEGAPLDRWFAPGVTEWIGRLALHPGDLVLDVGCGSGNAALAAARAGPRVTGIDLAPGRIAEARAAARDAGLPVQFEVGDAEALPFADGEFSAALSLFGVVFAARPGRAAAELLRVTARGGVLALTAWTPDSCMGRLLGEHAAWMPRLDGLLDPHRWGVEAAAREHLGSGVTDWSCERRVLECRFPFAPAAVTELFAVAHGPTVAALRGAEPSAASALRAGLTRLFREHNHATDGSTVVAAEYLDIRARKA